MAAHLKREGVMVLHDPWLDTIQAVEMGKRNTTKSTGGTMVLPSVAPNSFERSPHEALHQGGVFVVV